MRNIVNATRTWVRAAIIASVCGAVGIGTIAYSQTDKAKDGVTTGHASGTFDVKLMPLTLEDKAADPTLGRMSIEKKLLGDLEGTSKGEMLMASTTVKGSAGYVAMERVTGKLGGRSGSFVLQHSATMTRGEPQLSVTVVPDSGTDQLVGLTGKLMIKIEGTKHSYEFDYTLPGK